jgi:hypothetical protein
LSASVCGKERAREKSKIYFFGNHLSWIIEPPINWWWRLQCGGSTHFPNTCLKWYLSSIFIICFSISLGSFRTFLPESFLPNNGILTMWFDIIYGNFLLIAQKLFFLFIHSLIFFFYAKIYIYMFFFLTLYWYKRKNCFPTLRTGCALYPLHNYPFSFSCLLLDDPWCIYNKQSSGFHQYFNYSQLLSACHRRNHKWKQQQFFDIFFRRHIQIFFFGGFKINFYYIWGWCESLTLSQSTAKLTDALLKLWTI